MNGWRIVRIPVAWGRRLGIGRNSLRRGVDRTEAVAVFVAMVLALIAVPFVLAAGNTVYRANLAEAATQAANSHQTTAVLLQDAPRDSGLDAGLDKVTAPGRWRTSSGVERTGQVLAIPGEKAGTAVTVWIDRAGQQVDQPTTADQAYWRGMLTDIIVMVGVVCVLGCALAVVRWRLNRRRYADWDADWSETEPRWTQRAH